MKPQRDDPLLPLSLIAATAINSLLSPLIEQQITVVARLLATIKIEAQMQGLALALAAMRQGELCLVKNQVIANAFQNQTLFAASQGYPHNLKLVPSPSDAEDLGEIG